MIDVASWPYVNSFEYTNELTFSYYVTRFALYQMLTNFSSSLTYKIIVVQRYKSNGRLNGRGTAEQNDSVLLSHYPWWGFENIATVIKLKHVL